MILSPTPLAGLTEVRTAAVTDTRGRFVRVFCDDALGSLQKELRVVQVNLSTTTTRGSIRGMHYQLPPAAEGKLIRCLRGRVFDVAVDLRTRSPTFLRWHAVELAADEDVQIFIPKGFAHGFQTLTDDAQLLYLHTARWSPEHERRVRFDDSRIGIRWPLPPAEVSPGDRATPLLADAFHGIDA